MALTWGDDYPIHQTPEPVAYAGTDRNFYDRYFFNGYAPQGDGNDLFFAAAFGVYPHLNIADAAFCVMRDGKQVNLHASRWLKMERMDLNVGPISIAVETPLQRLKLTVAAPEQGIAAEIVFEGRAFPIEEPRFIRRNGPRTLLDYTRLTQNGRYSGWIEVDGVRTSVDGFVGARDRSWGVRPVGSRDPQELAPPTLPQFFWLWAPCNFEDGSLFFHTNDDELGRAWNRRAVWLEDGGREDDFGGFAQSACAIAWKSGTRHAAAATIDLGADGSVTVEPKTEFFMLGLGYNHPVWGHGSNHGALKVEREDFVTAEMDRKMPHLLHVQALSDVTYVDGAGRTRKGRGVFEQLAIGPHAPSGFASILDMAPMSLAERLEAYLIRTWGQPITVADLSRIPGGASRETYRFAAKVGDETRPLILRRDPTGSLIETDRNLEYLALESFHDKLPAPRPVAMDAEGAELERPFFIMERVEGGAAASPFTVLPYGDHARAIGERFFQILGVIAAAEPAGLPLAKAAPAPAPEDCWRVALDQWSDVIDADEQHPQPIVRAAIRALRRKPPPPATAVRVVHGDYRTGNFLHDGAGKILAILDWEMVHLGDPLEDLAWAIDPLWGHFDAANVAGMIPRADALSIWSKASGLPVDEAALAWWSLFAAVKGQAIWTSAAKEYRDGGFKEPILAVSGWYTARRHDEILAAMLLRLEGLS